MLDASSLSEIGLSKNMEDHSHLDDKYFLGIDTYNCPFCNRRHVTYQNLSKITFDWSDTKTCEIWRVQCNSCKKISMHLPSINTRTKPLLYPAVFHSWQNETLQ